MIILAVGSNRVSRPHREGSNHLVRLGIDYSHRIGTEVDSFVSTVEPYLVAAYSLDRSQGGTRSATPIGRSLTMLERL